MDYVSFSIEDGPFYVESWSGRFWHTGSVFYNEDGENQYTYTAVATDSRNGRTEQTIVIDVLPDLRALRPRARL